MKTILALSMAIITGSALAQSYSSENQRQLEEARRDVAQAEYAQTSGSRHMIQFNADSLLRATLSFSKAKQRGEAADNDTELDLGLNYAYSVPTIPRLQLGGRVNYIKDVSSLGDFENYGAEVGAIYNHTADLENAAYASLYLGMLWNNQYDNTKTALSDDDEVRLLTVALGKRFNLERWGVKHLVYSPEVALQTKNSTTGSSFEYTQDLQFRFVQFSLFF